MHNTVQRSARVLLAATALCGTAALADDVYKWVAPDGVTHYSETAPEAALASVEIIAVDDAGPAGAAPRGYQSALEVANSIEASRLARERMRLEKRRQRLQQQSQAVKPATGYPAPATRLYYPGYRYYYGRPRVQHPPRMRYRPEPRSPAPYYTPPNSLAHIRP